MKLIVGLGNPGDKYTHTRHNAGFFVIEKLAREIQAGQPDWKMAEKHDALIAKAGGVLLAKPTTYMNASGSVVRRLLSYYKLTNDDLWVIHDDMDIPLGKVRIRKKGSAAGHHGVESIIRELGTDIFVRFRLGVGRESEATKRIPDKNLHRRFVISFVLSRFTRKEAGLLKHLVKYGTEAARVALSDGIDRAMNRFN